MAKTGRPSTYTPEIASIICARLSNGEALPAICAAEGIGVSTVYQWLQARPEFADQYARAREDQADTLAAQITALADEEPRMVVDDKGVARIDSAWVAWQKNRVDARKWVASKLKPKAYGERVAVAGDPSSPIKVEAEVHAEKLLKAILENAQLNRQADES